MTEYRRGQLVQSVENRYEFKPITVRIKSTDKNIYGVIAEQHPQIVVDQMRIGYIKLVKLSVGTNSYLEVEHNAVLNNTSKLHINKTVTRYYNGGETEELMLIAKVDVKTGELEIEVPNDFVIEVKLATR